MYTVHEQEMDSQMKEFRARYPQFVPYQMSEHGIRRLVALYLRALATQNGQDVDDYIVGEDSRVARYLGHLRTGAKVLMVGVGSGREVLVAQSMGLDAHGVTFGSRNLAFATSVLDIPTERIVECAAESIEGPVGFYDCIIGLQFFEHVLAPFVFLLNMNLLLKAGGEIILEWPPPRDTTGTEWGMGCNPHHQVCYIPGQAKDLLLKAGFNNIRLFYTNMQDIPEDRIWDGIHPHHLCISANKITIESGEEHIKRILQSLPAGRHDHVL